MLERELQIALQAVSAACVLCENVRRDLVSADTVAKKDKSPVTVADFGSQAVILRVLADAFPDDRIVAEEDSAALRGNEALLRKVVEHVSAFGSVSTDEVCRFIDHGRSDGGATGRFWTLDPIDGTKGFIRGDHYAVALGLIVDGRVELGVLGCPRLPAEGTAQSETGGVLLDAVRGEGCRMRVAGCEPVDVSAARHGSTSEANFCESVESGHTSHVAAARVAADLGVMAEPVRIDSQCKYAIVARGDASIYLRLPTRPGYEEKIWDHAAGSILVEEAGGTVTDTAGKPLDFSLGRTLKANKGVVATNGRFHEQVIDAVRRALNT